MPATPPTAADLAAFTEQQLDALRTALEAERERRQVLLSAPQIIDQVRERYRSAAGIHDGTAWVQPTGAHDAVPPGGKRVFEGYLWENTSGQFLAHSPAAFPSGWTKGAAAQPQTPDPGQQPAWVVGKAYKINDTVSYQGKVYRVIQAHTSAAHWTPDAVASLYVKV